MEGRPRRGGGTVPDLGGTVAALAVVGVALLGVLLTFVSAWTLSRTILCGQVSTFSLELPPYRPPRILQTLYTSIIDRTLLAVWRAVVWAMPAGALIWLTANIHVGGRSIAGHLIATFDPVGLFVGLNGVILLAYILAIPANEIVIPTVLMLTVLATGAPGVGQGAGVMFDLDDSKQLLSLLRAGGWTLLTGVNLMLFSLIHNPTIVARVERRLGEQPDAAMAWEPIPLDVYTGPLPAGIRSSWVFILRANTSTGAERHPNSHQRMLAYRGDGDFQTRTDGAWASHWLTCDRARPLVERWISIPPSVWHQGVVPARDWVVVSFHTATVDALIEERPAEGDTHEVQQSRYVPEAR